MLKCNNKYISEKLSETWNIHVKSEAFCSWEVSCSENMDWGKARVMLAKSEEISLPIPTARVSNIGILVLHSLHWSFLPGPDFSKNTRNKEQYSWMSGFSVQHPDLYVPNPQKIISDWATLSSELHSWFRFCNSEFF